MHKFDYLHTMFVATSQQVDTVNTQALVYIYTTAALDLQYAGFSHVHVSCQWIKKIYLLNCVQRLLVPRIQNGDN